MIQEVTLSREYQKGGKFKEYVDACRKSSGLSPEEEMKKVIVQEYFKTVQKNGCNEDKVNANQKGVKVNGTANATGANQC